MKRVRPIAAVAFALAAVFLLWQGISGWRRATDQDAYYQKLLQADARGYRWTDELRMAHRLTSENRLVAACLIFRSLLDGPHYDEVARAHLLFRYGEFLCRLEEEYEWVYREALSMSLPFEVREEGLYRLGDLRAQRGDLEGAMAHFVRMTEQDEMAGLRQTAAYWLAEQCLAQKRYEEAFDWAWKTKYDFCMPITAPCGNGIYAFYSGLEDLLADAGKGAGISYTREKLDWTAVSRRVHGPTRIESVATLSLGALCFLAALLLRSRSRHGFWRAWIWKRRSPGMRILLVDLLYLGSFNLLLLGSQVPILSEWIEDCASVFRVVYFPIGPLVSLGETSMRELGASQSDPAWGLWFGMMVGVYLALVIATAGAFFARPASGGRSRTA